MLMYAKKVLPMYFAIISFSLLALLAGCGGDCIAPGGCNNGTAATGGTNTTQPPSSGTYTVLYVVSGTATQASLTYSNSQGGTAQETVNLPWQRQFSMIKGDFLYISAQNQGDTGSVTTEIRVNGVQFKSTTSSGAFVIATASGSCC